MPLLENLLQNFTKLMQKFYIFKCRDDVRDGLSKCSKSQKVCRQKGRKAPSVKHLSVISLAQVFENFDLKSQLHQRHTLSIP